MIVMHPMTRHFKAEKLHLLRKKLKFWKNKFFPCFLYAVLYPLSQKVAKISLKNKNLKWAEPKNAKMLVDAREVLVSVRNLQKSKLQIISFQTHHLRSVLDHNLLRK